MRVLLRAREQGGSYAGPLFKLPSNRAVTQGIFAHPKNSEMVGSGLEPASPGSEASTQPTEPPDHPCCSLRVYSLLRDGLYYFRWDKVRLYLVGGAVGKVGLAAAVGRGRFLPFVVRGQLQRHGQIEVLSVSRE